MKSAANATIAATLFFVIVPAAVELSNWTTRERTLIIGGSAAVTATLGTHLIFVCC